jgi:hypothetical protein
MDQHISLSGPGKQANVSRSTANLIIAAINADGLGNELGSLVLLNAAIGMECKERANRSGGTVDVVAVVNDCTEFISLIEFKYSTQN